MRKYFSTARLLSFLLPIVLASAAFAQQATPKPSLPPNVEEHKLQSKLMAGEVPFRVVLPSVYAAEKEARFPVLYLLHGLGGSNANWTDRTKLSEYAARHRILIVTPEGGNGWYSDHQGRNDRNYESYIVKELIPEIDRKFRTQPSRAKRAIAGLSMGGYGALKFGAKYPDLFALAGSFSGAVAASSYMKIADLPEGNLRTALVSIFGEPGSPFHASNDLFKIVRDASPEKIRSFPFFYVDCGTEDFLFQSNRQFIDLMIEKKISHEYRQLPGGHDWKYWDRQVQELLRIADATLARN